MAYGGIFANKVIKTDLRLTLSGYYVSYRCTYKLQNENPYLIKAIKH